MASKLLSNPSVYVGDIVSYKNVSFSVIYVNHEENLIVLFEYKSTKRHGKSTTLEELFGEIREGKATIIHEERSFVPPDEQNPIYKTRLAVKREIEKAFGPTYLGLLGKQSKPELQEIENRLHVGHTLVCKVINLFFSNGCDETALYPAQNKARPLDPDKEYARRGAKAKEADLQSEIIVINNPEIIKLFEKYKKEILNSYFFTLTAAYEDMIGKHFLRVISYTDENGEQQLDFSLLPCDIPTIRQFRYWFMNNTTYDERMEAKKGVWKFKNNYRSLFGDSYSRAYGPGDLTEADHWEVPVYLKSLFSNDSVSKATLSVLMCNYTGAPITLNLSFDNNKNRAITSLLLSLTKSKKELCKEYGIEISEADWPSGYCPHIIRVDGGPDFTSHNTVRVAGENKFELQIVPPGMGSYKPNVERYFGTLNRYLASLLEGKGYITKMPNSHPEKEACLTIDDLFRLILKFTVMYYKSYRTHYKASKEMLQKDIEITPLGLYEFGSSKYGAPKPIRNKDAFYWSLLMDDIPVYITKDGLHFNKTLEYADRKNKDLYKRIIMYGKNKPKFPARYDPRDISNLYYINEGHLIAVPLKPAFHDYAGSTLYEYDRWHEKENKNKRYGRFDNLKNKAIVRKDSNQHVNSTIQSQEFTPGTQYMKENTSIEREETAKKRTVAKAIQSSAQSAQAIEAPKPIYTVTPGENEAISVPHNQQVSTVQSMKNLRKTMNKR